MTPEERKTHEKQMIEMLGEEMLLEINIDIMQVLYKQATGTDMSPKQIADLRNKKEKERQMKKDFKLT